ncbi:hypothetical protein Noda2021_03890 [Candidatus Dependentiae bacterium Noda2021]|nr:hypothetical protein Noda2021_03890 [Candidatus Dependentiae bacterium Noda2021]
MVSMDDIGTKCLYLLPSELSMLVRPKPYDRTINNNNCKLFTFTTLNMRLTFMQDVMYNCFKTNPIYFLTERLLID